jgi:hypothetical protein
VTRSRAVDWTRLLRTFLEVLRSTHIFPTTGEHGTSLLLLRDSTMRVPTLLVSLLAGLLGVCGEPSDSARGLIDQSAQLEAVVGPIRPRPTASLSTVAEDYQTLTHAGFPQHAVRIARVHDFCDPTVRCANPCRSLRLFLRSSANMEDTSVYSGYVDVEARHLFFYFFESRRDPEKDDVVMWINGGACRRCRLTFILMTPILQVPCVSSLGYAPSSATNYSYRAPLVPSAC